jgi:OmcA/MtrC family decaheme c-type cytochrome
MMIESAEITGGVATVTFRIADAEGTPLDYEGRFTEGPVSMSFVLARMASLPDGPGVYTSYTTRMQMSDITGETAVQAAADTGGTYEELEPGQYRYTFGTAIDLTEPALTHTVGVWATRVHEGTTSIVNVLYDFVPAGGTPLVREPVTEANCNSCHGEVSAHGGARKSIRLCTMCHSPQTVDPDTRNSMDFQELIHKIHRGEHLPSVEAGEPYRVIGFRGSVHDYSTVVFPQALNRCESCHGGETGQVWNTRPTRAACVACHDRTSFVDPPPTGFALHTGGARADDSDCNVCHTPSGGIAGVRDLHYMGLLAADRQNLTVEIDDILDTSPGSIPRIQFTVQVDGMPRNIQTSPLNSLRATVAGPNTDYRSMYQATIQGSGAGGTLTAIDAAAGRFEWTFPATLPIPATATGSFTLGLEGYLQVTGGPRNPALNPTRAFAVTDPMPEPRRLRVAIERCDNCHYELQAHGGARTDPQYCAMCHLPNLTNLGRMSRVEGTSATIHSLDLKVFIHRIHSGEELTQPYVLGGNPSPSVADPDGNPIDFRQMRYPRPRNECVACHEEGVYGLPIEGPRELARVEQRTCTEPADLDTDSYCTGDYWELTSELRMPPETAVCTSCHDQPYVLAHAQSNTSPSGVEACATCHGPGSELDVMVVHSPAN